MRLIGGQGPIYRGGFMGADSGFDPLSVLFGAGEVGFVGEVLPQYLWQDTARTTPVTADGDPVASWALRGAGGSVIYATQATAGNRPVYNTAAGLHWLTFDGATSNRWLETPTITPGTDKVQVFAGVRKLSDAAVGVPVELSASASANAGSFVLAAPGTVAANYFWSSRGSGLLGGITTSNSYAAPITNVVTGTGDIAGDVRRLRINGVQVGEDLGDQGTGNFLAYPIYIGRRGGASLPFNGRLYSLIVRFGANLGNNILGATEGWTNARAGAF